jgi:5S rRNA maturation endonuclease (ribonuclease M5)
MGSAYERLLDALAANSSTVRSRGQRAASAQCPAHEDRAPSLSVTGIEGQALLYCHAGCHTEDILAALNLTKADLFDEARGVSYRYDNGRRVDRTPDKRFRQAHTESPPELYRLAKVCEAVASGKAVYVVEGEKDVHAIESLGAVATCSPMGAGKWAKVDPSPLYGGNIVIIADQDEPGRKHAADVATSLHGHSQVLVVAPVEGKDAADHIAAGHRLEELVPIAMETHDQGQRRMVLTPADTIRPKPVFWLWKKRLALGTLGLLAGREGLGKSTLAYWAAARVTRGELYGHYEHTPKAVLICATEDSWEHTIVPRLMAAGADLSKIYRVDVVSALEVHVGLSLPRDLHELEHNALAVDAALLLLDPLMSRLGDLDTHRDAEVRQALEPLVAIADRTGMAILGLIHHNKGGSTDPLQLVMGSKAFTAVARSVHTVVPDPDDEEDRRRLFGTPKNNLGRTDLPTFSFTIESHRIDTDEGDAWTGMLVWGEQESRNIYDLMRSSADSPQERTDAKDAQDWLKDYLESKGGSAPSAGAKFAAKAAGHSDKSIRTARERLKIEVVRTGFQGGSEWRIPFVPSFVPTSRGEGTNEMNDVNAQVSPFASFVPSHGDGHEWGTNGEASRNGTYRSWVAGHMVTIETATGRIVEEDS